jgi:hypothetical protein
MTDATIANIVTATVTIVTMVIGFLTLWVKLKYGVDKVQKVEDKLDDNTKVTKDGNVAAESHAKAAVTAAENAATKAETLSSQLNGKLEERMGALIKQQLEPIVDMLKDHVVKDETSFAEVNEHLGKLVASKGCK